MKIDNDANKRYMIYTAAGVGTGAIAGGTFGYLQRPWIKNGELTDTFIKQVGAANLEDNINKTDRIINDLKKIANTGSFDNVSEYTKYLLREEKDLPPELIKLKSNLILNTLQTEHNANNLDELPQKIKEDLKKHSTVGVQKNIDELKALQISEDISAEEIAKLYEEKVSSWTEKTVEKIQQDISTKGKKSVIEELKQDIANQINYYQEEITEFKNSIKEHIDISGKKMKDLPTDADLNDKEFHNIIKKTISKINRKNAGKWAGIGATVLGVVGLGTSYLTNKKNG